MLRQILLAVPAVCIVGIVAQCASAQSGGAAAPLTLGQRLQQFRQDLLGGDPQPDPPPARQPTPARPGQKVAAPQSANRPIYTAARPTPPPTAQPKTGDDMPSPPPSWDDDDAPPTPQSRLKSVGLESSRSSKPVAATNDDSFGDEGGRMNSRRGGAGSGSAARSNSALNPIPVDAARRPEHAAKSRLTEGASEDPADRLPEPAPVVAARQELKAEAKAEARAEARAESKAEAKAESKAEWKGSRVAEPTLDSPSHAAGVATGPSLDDSISAGKRGPVGVLTAAQSASLLVETVGPKSVTVGKEAAFSIKVRNSGDTAAGDVLLTIAIPSHVEVMATSPTGGSVQAPAASEESTTLQWRINRVDPRGKETLTLKLVPRKSLPIELAVQWTVAPDALQTLVEVQEPRLTMSLAGPSEILYGQSKIYKIIIANPGNGDAENVTVNLLPIGRASDGGASRRMGTLRPGQSKTIEVELTARQSGMLNIKAEASADGGLTASAVEQVVVRRASLTAVVQAPRVKFAGTAANYTILVGNAGNASAENVVLTAMLPQQAKFVSGTSGGKVDAAQGKVTWNIGSLPSTAERTFEVHCVLQAAGDNRMHVSATASDDQSVSATGMTRVDAVADLKLEIKDPQGPVAVGEDAVYEVLVRNRGSKSAEGVDLVAFFTEGLEAVRVHGAAHEIGRGQVVFRTIPSLAPGAELAIKIHARAEAGGNHVFRAEVACQSPQLKLSAEETTLFYGDDNGSPTTDPASASRSVQP